MSHYDLYASLGLDRAADPATLAAEIDRRLASSWNADEAQLAELRTARAVLGDAGRRTLYDRRLSDPSAPPVSLADLEELAAMPGSDSAPAAGQGPGGSDETRVLPFGANVPPNPGYGQQGAQGYGQQGAQPYNGNPYAPQGPPTGAPAAPPASSTKWILPAVLGAVVAAIIAVAATWFVMRGDNDGDDRNNTASGFTTSPTSEQASTSTESSRAPETTERPSPSGSSAPTYSAPGGSSFDPYSEVRVTRATATTSTCEGRDCVRIEIALEGDGEPEIIDGFYDGELQIDIYGVEVAYQDSFPVDNRADGKFDYLVGTSDEYDWPRLSIGVPEGTDYTVDNDYRNHHIIVEVYV